MNLLLFIHETLLLLYRSTCVSPAWLVVPLPMVEPCLSPGATYGFALLPWGSEDVAVRSRPLVQPAAISFSQARVSVFQSSTGSLCNQVRHSWETGTQPRCLEAVVAAGKLSCVLGQAARGRSVVLKRLPEAALGCSVLGRRWDA